MVTITHLLCNQQFCQLCKKVILLLSEHGDVIIERQTECWATYLSFWILLEQCLATSGEKAYVNPGYNTNSCFLNQLHTLEVQTVAF